MSGSGDSLDPAACTGACAGACTGACTGTGLSTVNAGTIASGGGVGIRAVDRDGVRRDTGAP